MLLSLALYLIPYIINPAPVLPPPVFHYAGPPRPSRPSSHSAPLDHISSQNVWMCLDVCACSGSARRFPNDLTSIYDETSFDREKRNCRIWKCIKYVMQVVVTLKRLLPISFSPLSFTFPFLHALAKTEIRNRNIKTRDIIRHILRLLKEMFFSCVCTFKCVMWSTPCIV